MKIICLGIVVTIACWGSNPAEAGAQQWAQFRGPGARGVAEDPRLPERWDRETNIQWRRAIPGMGWSSPIVWGDRIFVTTAISEGEIEAPRPGLYFGGERPASTDDHRFVVYALDFETGEVAWEREVYQGAAPGPRHLKNSYASETPVTDGERVYAYFGNVGLFVFDMAGAPLWDRRWEPEPTRLGWGTAASPALHGDRIYIINDNDGQSWLEAIDKRTGETAWRVPRDEASNWATPFVWENELRTEIVTPGTGRVISYGLGGEPLWEFAGMSSITIATPFEGLGLLYISSGYVGDRRRPIYALRPGARGDVTLTPGATSNESIAWSQPTAGPYNPSTLLYGDYLYVLLDRGFFACYDARTGAEVYGRQRMEGAYTASPWAYNGSIFALNEAGETTVIEAGPEFGIAGRNDLGEMSLATPAIAGGSLILRTAGAVYRIGGDGSRNP